MEPRRSSRLNTYDSNGRDYLADTIGWSREKLNGWITSPSVRPHLQLWSQLCIAGGQRYNDAIEWINTGERGYFYSPNDLEEDLLLMCLCEGNENEVYPRDTGRDGAAYSDEDAKTGKWITQELWARTAWKIVQNNKGEGEAFGKHVEKHPSICYSFVIELLCLAFHSIAFRGGASTYEQLINGNRPLAKTFGPGSDDHKSNAVQTEGDAVSTTTIVTTSSSTETADHSSDADFTECEDLTSVTNRHSVALDEGQLKDSAGTTTVHEWMNKLPQCGLIKDPWGSDQTILRLVDENGIPITGYRRVT